jgi:CheY-specific phosphatase CheX/anti-anti-sigma regulatory factor
MQYETIRRFYEKNLLFSLYKTFRVATLFTTPSVGNESILVWNENYEQRNLQGIELFEMGYNPVVAHRKKDFIDHLKRENAYEEIVEDTYIGSVGIVPFARVSGSAVIYTLQGYLDATIEQQFDYIYHNKAIRTGFKLFIFDMKNIVSMNVKVLDFFERLVKDTTQIGGTICIVNLEEISSLRKIREELEEMNIQLFKNLEEILNNKELMIELGGVVKDDKEHHKALTKNLINHLPSFINATVTTLEMMVAIKAVKADRIKIKELELKDKKQKIASSIGFYGDLEGIIILVFPIELAKKSCSTMIGEEITSMGEVLDSLAEFVNIIAGRVKTYLEDQKIGVSITLPRTYASIDELFETLTMHKGVQVDLNFNQETFTFFLTR